MNISAPLFPYCIVQSTGEPAIFVNGGNYQAKLGTETIDCVGYDKAGNKATNSFDVTMEKEKEKINDERGPISKEPLADIFVETIGRETEVTFTIPSLWDEGDSQWYSTVCEPESGSIFKAGTSTYVQCIAFDSFGYAGGPFFQVHVTQNLNLIPDTIPPKISPPRGLIVDAQDSNGTIVDYGEITAWDNRAPSRYFTTCDPVTGSLFPIGNTIVTCTATDLAGNIGKGTFSVIVEGISSQEIFANKTIQLKGGGRNIDVNPQTNTVFVGNRCDDSQNCVTFIDSLTDEITDEVIVRTSIDGLAVNSETNKVYVAGDGRVSVINAQQKIISSYISVCKWVVDVFVNSNTNTIYTSCEIDNLYRADSLAS